MQKAIDLYGVGIRNVGDTGNTTLVVKKSLIRVLETEQRIAQMQLDLLKDEVSRINGRNTSATAAKNDIQAFMNEVQHDGSEKHLIDRTTSRRRESIKLGVASAFLFAGGALSMAHGIIDPGYKEGFIGASPILVGLGAVPSAFKSRYEYVKYKTDRLAMQKRSAAKSDNSKTNKSDINTIASAKEASLIIIEASFLHDPYKRFTELEKAEKLYNTAMVKATKLRSISPEVREAIRSRIKEKRGVVERELDLLRTHILKENLDLSKGRISKDLLKKFVRQNYSDGSQEELEDKIKGRKLDGIQRRIVGIALGSAALTNFSLGRFNTNKNDTTLKEALVTSGLVLTIFAVEQISKSFEDFSRWRVEVRAMKRKPLKKEVTESSE